MHGAKAKKMKAQGAKITELWYFAHVQKILKLLLKGCLV
jgi:hypothetical protein